jgi:hypothetical protein
MKINAGTVSGQGFDKWFVFIDTGDGHNYRIGPFSKNDVDEITRHYCVLEALIRKAVLAEVRASLGIEP